jgi:selenocysteine-specific elongation factor
VVEGLKALANLDPEALVAYHAAASKYAGVSFQNLIIMTNLPEKKLEAALQALLSRRELICSDKENRIYIHGDTVLRLQGLLQEQLDAYHRANPLKAGMPKEELRSKCPTGVGDKLFHLILQLLIKDEQVVTEEEWIRLASHRVRLAVNQAEIKEKMLAAYRDSGLTPPYFKDLTATLGMTPGEAKDVLMLLVGEQALVKIREELYFHAQAIAALQEKLVRFLEASEEISMPQFKELSGVSRKYAVPLMEFFDSRHVTLRIGDIRKLRRR